MTPCLREMKGQARITSKKKSLYVTKLVVSHFSRSTSSFREARAANLIPKGLGIMSSTDDSICKMYKKNKLNERKIYERNALQKFKAKNNKDAKSSHKLTGSLQEPVPFYFNTLLDCLNKSQIHSKFYL